MVASAPLFPKFVAEYAATYRELRKRGTSPQPRVQRLTAERLGEGEDVVDVVQLDTGGRRGAADEVEHLAVLEPVVGQPLNPALLVEVDRDHPLVGDGLVHEGELLLGALGDVIEHLAADGGDGGGRAE